MSGGTPDGVGDDGSMCLSFLGVMVGLFCFLDVVRVAISRESSVHVVPREDVVAVGARSFFFYDDLLPVVLMMVMLVVLMFVVGTR